MNGSMNLDYNDGLGGLGDKFQLEPDDLGCFVSYKLCALRRHLPPLYHSRDYAYDNCVDLPTVFYLCSGLFCSNTMGGAPVYFNPLFVQAVHTHNSFTHVIANRTLHCRWIFPVQPNWLNMCSTH